MARLRFAERVADDAATIWSPRVEAYLRRVLAMLEAFPEAGSPNVPESIRREFGPNVRKCAVNPYDLVYEYDAEKEEVRVYALINQRMAT